MISKFRHGAGASRKSSSEKTIQDLWLGSRGGLWNFMIFAARCYITHLGSGFISDVDLFCDPGPVASPL